MFKALRNAPAFSELLAVSHRLGTDPLQVQGPGGNTSIKSGDVMWIKASGTWLADAMDRDIMVPCDVGVLRRALSSGALVQPDPAELVPVADNPSGLRPSIETAVHAALDWPVVLHTHCVATISLACRRDGAERIAGTLTDIEVAFVPYVKPGWDLARAIQSAATPSTQVIVLGNHGLVVCAQTPDEAEALLRQVSRRLEPSEVRAPLDASQDLSNRLAGSTWIPAPEPVTHAVACDPVRLKMALGATLYPDHLIFLGPGCIELAVDATPDDALADGVPRKILLLPGLGTAVPKDATSADLALARCLGDVMARIEDGAALNRLTRDQEAELLNWDAEKYRQALAARA